VKIIRLQIYKHSKNLFIIQTNHPLGLAMIIIQVILDYLYQTTFLFSEYLSKTSKYMVLMELWAVGFWDL